MSENETQKTPRRFAAEIPFQPVSGEWTPRKSGAARGPRERTDYQKQLDSLIKSQHNTGKAVFLEVDATEQAMADLEKRIRASAEYLGVGVRFGADQKSPNKGKVVMSFLVKDKRQYKPKTSDSEK